MSLCAVVFVLASILIGNWAGTIEVTVLAHAPPPGTGGTTTKSGTIDSGTTVVYGVGTILNGIVTWNKTFKGKCYFMSQAVFEGSMKLGISVPFPTGWTFDLTQADRAEFGVQRAATAGVIGRVLHDFFIILERKLTEELKVVADVVVEGIGTDWNRYSVVKSKTSAKLPDSPDLLPCVLLVFNDGHLPCRR